MWNLALFLAVLLVLAEARPPFPDNIGSISEDDEYNAVLDRMIEEILGLQLGSLHSQSTTPEPPPAISSLMDFIDNDDEEFDHIEAFDNQGDDGVSPVWLPFYVIAPKIANNHPVSRQNNQQIQSAISGKRTAPSKIAQSNQPTNAPPSWLLEPKRRQILTTPHFLRTRTPHLNDDCHEVFGGQHSSEMEPSSEPPPARRPFSLNPAPSQSHNRQTSYQRDENKILSSDPLRCKINIVDVQRCFLRTASSCQASSWTVDVTVNAVVTAPVSEKYAPSSVLYLPTYISSISVSSAAPVTNNDDKNFWNRFIKRTNVITPEDSASSSPLEIRMQIETSCCLRQLRIDWMEASSYVQGAPQQPRFCELDLCNGNFCLNRGVCTPNNLCFCQSGWSGKHCERSPLFDQTHNV